ncbi:MAG: helix-turn-helix domain-containing protein [Thermoguttaceae bacterium]
MYYNLQKAADVLGLTTGEVNRLREQGKLRAYKDGADWKFRKEEVDKLAADMIRERSKANNDGLLTTEDDDEKTTFADSAAFDSMFDQAGDDLQISLNEQKADAASVADSAEDAFNLSLEGEDDAFELAPESDSAAPAQEEDGLTLAEEPADDGLTLAEEPADDGLTLAEEPKEEDGLILSSEDSALAEDVKASGSDSGSGLSLDGDSGLELLGGSDSGSGLNLSTSDSGLELLDEVGSSDVNLAGDGDLVLGGSGSGSGLNLNSGDSGLELMSDSDGGFELDQASEDLSLAEEDPAKEDESVFELATDTDAAVLNLDKDADSEAATELAPEESVFQLSDQTLGAASTNPSESMSSGVFSVEEKSSEATNPFVTDDGSDDADDDSDGIFGLAEEPAPAATSSGDSQSESRSIDVEEASSDAASLFTTSDDDSNSPFGAPEPASDASPFGAPDAEASPFGGLSFDKAEPGADGGFGAADFGASSSFGAAGSDEPSFSAVDTSSAPAIGGGGTAPSTQFVGKDLIFLVPCFLFLLLATIGACELCRTIWSYEQGSFDLGGPLLEAIAKMVNLM